MENHFRTARRRRRDEAAGELNIVPYLDILINLIMFLLVTQSTLVSLGLVDVSAPSYVTPGPPRPAADPDSVKLTLGIATSGFFIAGSGGVLPGRSDADGPTIPRLESGAFDYRALAATLRSIKDAFAETSSIYITADGDIPYEVLVKTLDASRADERGPLFPAVAFTEIK